MNNNEIDGMLALLRAMNGEKNVNEHMEAEGQQSAVKNIMMAKKMEPSIEYWEKLGFKFEDIPGDDVLYSATLPEGWSLKATDHSMWNEIFDEKGLKRGSMFYKASFYDRKAHMYLSPRYSIHTDYIGNGGSTREIYFGNEQEKLFVAGTVHISENASEEEILAKYDEQDKLEKLARQYAEENYPDYNNVNAYWETGKKLVHKLSNEQNN